MRLSCSKWSTLCATFNLTDEELRQRAATLGADCAFFIDAQPAFAEGIGERLAPLPDLSERLKGLWILIVKPPVAVSTREGFQSDCSRTTVSVLP